MAKTKEELTCTSCLEPRGFHLADEKCVFSPGYATPRLDEPVSCEGAKQCLDELKDLSDCIQSDDDAWVDVFVIQDEYERWLASNCVHPRLTSGGGASGWGRCTSCGLVFPLS